MPRYHLTELFQERTSPNGKWISGSVPTPVREGDINRLFILAAPSRKILLEFDEGWDASEPTWSEDTASFRLRCYPGSHTPPELHATIDLAKRTARLATMDPSAADIPLGQLKSAVSRAIRWKRFG